MWRYLEQRALALWRARFLWTNWRIHQEGRPRSIPKESLDVWQVHVWRAAHRHLCQFRLGVQGGSRSWSRQKLRCHLQWRKLSADLSRDWWHNQFFESHLWDQYKYCKRHSKVGLKGKCGCFCSHGKCSDLHGSWACVAWHYDLRLEDDADDQDCRDDAGARDWVCANHFCLRREIHPECPLVV